MGAPQEIIDEVIDNLAFDFATLKSTSLVQKSWTHRSRRRLFYFIPIYSLDRLEQWSRSISADPEGIASYPRVLHLSNNAPSSWVEPANLTRFYDHFRSFSGVERLAISRLETAKFDVASTLHYFGNFTATLRSLELRIAIATPVSLFSFICMFPLLDDLAVQHPSYAAGDGEQGEVISAPRFKGELKLLDISHESTALVELLCTLPLPLQTISVSSRNAGHLPQLAKLVSKCGKTMRSLHIARKTHADILGPTGASLASCVALEVLRVTTIFPKHLVATLEEILPTLPKTANLSQIVLDADPGGMSEQGVVDRPAWNNFDSVLTECAEKISARHPNRRLELQLRTGWEGATGEYDGWARELVGSLVMFREVGDVKCVSKVDSTLYA